MKWLFVFLSFIPHFGFGKIKDIGALEGGAEVLQTRSAKAGDRHDNYIGTVQRVKDGKIVVRLRSDLEVRKKKTQVALTQFPNQYQNTAPFTGQEPVYVNLYDPAGVNRGRAKLSAVEGRRTVIFEVLGDRAQRTDVGWKIGLRDESVIRKDEKKDFGLGLFYELKWR